MPLGRGCRVAWVCSCPLPSSWMKLRRARTREAADEASMATLAVRWCSDVDEWDDTLSGGACERHDWLTALRSFLVPMHWEIEG